MSIAVTYSISWIVLIVKYIVPFKYCSQSIVLKEGTLETYVPNIAAIVHLWKSISTVPLARISDISKIPNGNSNCWYEPIQKLQCVSLRLLCMSSASVPRNARPHQCPIKIRCYLYRYLSISCLWQYLKETDLRLNFWKCWFSKRTPLFIISKLQTHFLKNILDKNLTGHWW